jgi:hypothetical protein
VLFHPHTPFSVNLYTTTIFHFPFPHFYFLIPLLIKPIPLFPQSPTRETSAKMHFKTPLSLVVIEFLLSSQVSALPWSAFGFKFPGFAELWYVHSLSSCPFLEIMNLETKASLCSFLIIH